MTIRRSPIHLLTDDEVKRFLRLGALRIKQGGMRDWLKWLRAFGERSHRGRVVWAVEGDVILGWGIFYVSDAKRDPGPWVHVYVRPKYRRKGVAGKLLRELVRNEPEAQASPYTFESRAFYLAHGFNRLVSATAMSREAS